MEGKVNYDNFDQCISTYIICYAQVDYSVFTDVVKKVTEMCDYYDDNTTKYQLSGIINV